MKVLVTASGSGGHLFPARFIMEELLARGEEVAFVGSGRELEQSILAPLNIPLHVINIVGVKNRGILGFLQFVAKTPAAYLQTKRLFEELQPELVIGVGGYASFFPVFFAWQKGIPTWIHEAELHLGLANRVLSYFADKVSVTSDTARFPISPKKVVYTGHPIRRDIVQGALWSGEPIPSRLLVLGGSQGARSLDCAVSSLAPWFAEHRIEIFHQCRPESQTELESVFQQHGVSARVETFVHDVVAAYAWAHVVLSRAGAATLTEIAMVGKPSILVPYPHAQGNHQFHNAMMLVEQGKAQIVEEGEHFIERLQESLKRVFEQTFFQAQRDKAQLIRPLNGASRIVEMACGLVGR